jgi:uncharacterized membrane protein YccC
MIGRTALALVVTLVCAGSEPASAEVLAWDGERVAALAKQLREATDALYDAFYRQPILGVAQNKDYYRLKQDTRRLRQESGHLSEALARGEGPDETRPIWEDLMQTVRSATDHSASVFTTQDVKQKADAARAILDQLAPYYESDAAASEPGRER